MTPLIVAMIGKTLQQEANESRKENWLANLLIVFGVGFIVGFVGLIVFGVLAK